MEHLMPPTPAPAPTPAPTPLASTLVRRLFLDRTLDVWRDQLGRGVRAGLVRARVLDVVQETPDTRTFVVRPGSGWTRHRAGQFTTIEVEIDGVRVRRCYSIS